MTPWPAHWPIYHNGLPNEVCDMAEGPCSCGAWHIPDEFRVSPDGLKLLRYGQPVADMPSPEQQITQLLENAAKLHAEIKHTREWWAERFHVLERDLIKSDMDVPEAVKQRFYNIIANGKAAADAPPQQDALMLIHQDHVRRAEVVIKDQAELIAVLKDALVDHGIECTDEGRLRIPVHLTAAAGTTVSNVRIMWDTVKCTKK
jgi:hypothetical protein